jgi:hypothetical protein
MQEQLESAQERLTDARVDGSAGGGAVSVTVNSIGELQSVAIKAGTFDDMDNDHVHLNYAPVRTSGLKSVEGNFDLALKDPPAHHRSSDCGGTVNLEGKLVIMAKAGSRGEIAEVDLQRQDSGSSSPYNLGWGWKFVPCYAGPALGEWQLSFRDLTGLDRNSKLILQDAGGLMPTAGITLDTLQQEGPLVHGLLHAGNGASRVDGWYRATLSHDQTGMTLQGEWGRGPLEGLDVISAWSGRKL